MSVISFAEAKAERQPHWTGRCKCVGCGHEWEAVAPIGKMWVDCPCCNLPKGTPKFPFGGAVGDTVFTCNCGSEALTAYFRKGLFRLRCMGCGTDHSVAIFGEAP